MIIAIGADHGGYEYKEYIKEKFAEKVSFIDCGAYELNTEDDYVDFAFAVAEAVSTKKADRGIFVCRTGVGASIAMNKVKGIFCGLAESKKDVELASKKNHINCLTFGADNVCKRNVCSLVETFLTTEKEGGRHQRRVDKIADYEKNK